MSDTGTLTEALRGAASRFGDAAAFVDAGGWAISFAELDRVTDEVAAGLAARDIGEGAVAALLLGSTVDYAVAYLALAKVGAVTAGVNPRFTADEQRRCLEVVRPDVVLATAPVGPDQLGDAAGAQVLVVPRATSVDDLFAAVRVAGGTPPALAPDLDRPVAIVLTSGTTGRPKGAVFTNRQLAAAVEIDTGGAWGGGGPMLAGTELAHVGFMTKLPWYLRKAHTLHLLDKWRAAEVLRIVESTGMAVVGGVAPQIALLLALPDFDEHDLNAVQALVIGGGPSSPALVEEARRRFGAAYSIRYSSTESGGVGTGTAFDADDEEALHTVGRPRAGIDLAIRDEAGADLPTGEIGEVCLRSGAVMDRYWRDPEATAATLVDGWLRTGDLGYLDEAGRLRLAGRRKEMYIRGGYNVYPMEVEAVLATHPQVANVAVAPRPDPVMGEIGVAVVVPRDAGDPPSLEDLRTFARERLSAHKLPEALRVVDELPLTTGHKVDRKALAAHEARPSDALPASGNLPAPAGVGDPVTSVSVDARPDLRALARLTGVVAATVALAVTELVRAVTADAPSLIVAVGDVFVDGLPGDVTRTVIGAIGTADKPALLLGIVVVALLIGAKTGTAALARPWVGDVVFAVFALLGALAGIRAPLTTDAGALFAAALGGVAGAVTLRLLLRTATTWTDATHPGGADAGRRQFLALAGTLGAFAAAVGLTGRSLGLGRTVEAARDDVVLPEVTGGTRPSAADAGLDVEGITPFVTQNADFYRIDTALTVPQVDPASWTLTVDGMVDEPFELTFAELLDLPLVEREVTISCVSNEVGGELVGNARWLGVPLRSLLRRAGVQDGASQVMGHSVDGFTAGFPTELLDDDRPALVAVGMNGEPLPLEHGFPARLIIGGIYGYVSATKWLSRIELTTLDAADGYWIPRGWAKEAPIKTQCRIDTPRSSDQDAGSVPVAGIAWAPTRGIAKVEVQVDDGPWQEARLGPGTSDDTWRQWVYDWRPTPGRYQLRARATDGEGETQTEETAPPAPDGATGYPTRIVTVR